MYSENTSPTTVICIPGIWKDRTEIVTSIVGASEGEYIFAGLVLLNIKTKESFKMEICERDERMKEAFTWAGKVTAISDEALALIERHTHVIYLSSETGSYKKAESIARAAGVLLSAGGSGVKIESAGKAFEKNLWTAYLENFETSDLYEMFVVDSIEKEDGAIYSCGMHNLGLKDTIVSGEEFMDAVQLIRIFGYYQIVDNPVINANETFTAEAGAPTFVIEDEINQPYAGHELFNNPYGMWRLRRRN